MKKSLLYTRTGDDGTTSLFSGNRVSKTHVRIEAYGTIDELNSHIGLLASQPSISSRPDLSRLLRFIQHRLFDLGAYLATDPDALRPGLTVPAPPCRAEVERLEHATDAIDSQLPPLRRFVLPGGSQAAAMAHVARTVCRRAERRILALSASAPVASEALQFVNRLSDLLFALARYCNIISGNPEIFWQKDC